MFSFHQMIYVPNVCTILNVVISGILIESMLYVSSAERFIWKLFDPFLKRKENIEFR